MRNSGNPKNTGSFWEKVKGVLGFGTKEKICPPKKYMCKCVCPGRSERDTYDWNVVPYDIDSPTNDDCPHNGVICYIGSAGYQRFYECTIGVNVNIIPPECQDNPPIET
jgi:hypothetical protein